VVAEAALHASEERQRHLLQQMPGFVAVLAGPNHVFEYVNDAYVTISGPRQFLGRSVREVFPELVGQGFYELLDRVYATGEPFSARDIPLRLAGEDDDRYIDLLYQPTRNDQGLVTGVFVGGYDTTERVRMQAYRDAQVRLTDRISDRYPGLTVSEFSLL
jgi:PAS domain-containing protein